MTLQLIPSKVLPKTNKLYSYIFFITVTTYIATIKNLMDFAQTPLVTNKTTNREKWKRKDMRLRTHHHPNSLNPPMNKEIPHYLKVWRLIKFSPFLTIAPRLLSSHFRYAFFFPNFNISRKKIQASHVNIYMYNPNSFILFPLH